MFPSLADIQIWAQTHSADPIWVRCFAAAYGRLPHDIGELVGSNVQPDPSLAYPPPGAKVTPTPTVGMQLPKLDLTTAKATVGPLLDWVSTNPITIPVALGLGYLALKGGHHRRRHFGL